MEKFRQLKPLAQPDLFMMLINSYIFYALVTAVTLTVDQTFIHLGANYSTLESLALIGIGFIAQVLLQDYLKQALADRVFVGLASVYLLLVIYKSPSLLITLSFFLLGFAIYAKLYLDSHPWRHWILIALLLTFPRALYRLYNGYPYDIGRFVIDHSAWNINQIWTIIFSLVYSLVLILLLERFISKQITKFSSDKMQRFAYWAVAIFGVVYVTYLSITVIYRIKTFAPSTFDIGIFTQMFESMRRDLSAITTLERDKPLSHFAVHVSPIYYLMLPFYAIWPYLETLEILQILIVFSGVIPLKLILDQLNLPKLIKPAVLLWFVLTPALTTAGNYFLHENCFLVPLLLWLIYANIRQWRWQLYLITALNLMVKEDAFIYVFSVGLYFLIQQRFALDKKQKWRVGLSQLVFPSLYFALGLYFLTTHGDGAMVTRFDNFLLAEEKGLGAVVKNILLNPSYTFASLFTQRKLYYVFLLFLTQAFLPLMQKRWENYLLLVPLIVINLLSDYVYQADFGFQYSYGTNTLVFFMSLLALDSLMTLSKSNLIFPRLAAFLVAIGIISSSAALYSMTSHRYSDTLTYWQNKAMYDSIHETLGAIDTDQQLLAFGAYTISLREAPHLYDLFYHNNREVNPEIDQIVLPRSIFEGDYAEAEVVKKYLAVGYKEAPESTAYVVILQK